MLLSLLDRACMPFAGIVDGLCDPKRSRRTTLLLVIAFAAAWTIYGVIAKSSQDINGDMAEMVIWARAPALGYPKHPPLLAYVVKLWFSVFPLADWAFTLLAVATVSAGLYLATELCAVWLQGEKRAAVPFLLAVIPFYTFLGLKFDQNSALIPLWALTLWAFMHSLETRRAGWSMLTGLAAAAAMMTKYWSAFLLVALALTTLLDRRRTAYWRSSAPWLTASVFIIVVLPHAIWLVQNEFPPLRWIATRREADSISGYLRSLTEYSAGTFGYAATALALGVVLFRPTRAAIRDGWFAIEPVRRPATLLFWTPLLLPVFVAMFTKTNLLSLWNEPALNLMPVMMLASPLVLVLRIAVRRLAAIVIMLTLLIVAASPIVALTILKAGVENNAAYARLAAEATEREWHETSSAPLRLVGGPLPLVSSAAFYMTDKPMTYADFSQYLSPWVNRMRLLREGVAIICPSDGMNCLERMAAVSASAPIGKMTEVTLTPQWLGLRGRPKDFVITTIPPRQ
jgi:4-amino-4-deoxy-L-arabinose transferase-like glycosyltransferase